MNTALYYCSVCIVKMNHIRSGIVVVMVVLFTFGLAVGKASNL